jgi:hypothetical protein
MNQPGRARRATVNDAVDPNAPLPKASQNPAPPRQGRGGAGAVAEGAGLDPTRIPGIVVDDAQAKLTGTWTPGTGIKGFVGAHYLYDNNSGRADCTARFEFKVPAAGAYEVRLAYAAHENRAKNVPVTVITADGEKQAEINQQLPGKADNGFASLGVFRFDPGAPGAVVVTNKGAKGHVSIDAVQVVPAK